MELAAAVFGEKPRLGSFLEHLGAVTDPRDVRRLAHPLAEVLLAAVCGMLADCDDYDHIAQWAESHLAFLRGFLPYEFGVPCGRWLTLLMNRINPALFSAAFMSWVCASWPDRPEFVAIDGKTSRRSHDRAEGRGPLHLVSAFAASGRSIGSTAGVAFRRIPSSKAATIIRVQSRAELSDRFGFGALATDRGRLCAGARSDKLRAGPCSE